MSGSLEKYLTRSRQARDELVQRLLGFPCLHGPNTRNNVLERLDATIRVRVHGGSDHLTFVDGLVDTCTRFAGGIGQLRNAIAFYERGTMHLVDPDEWLEHIRYLASDGTSGSVGSTVEATSTNPTHPPNNASTAHTASATAPVTHMHFHGPITHMNVQTGSGTQTVTTNVTAPAPEPRTTDQALALLREEMLAIQDQLINQRKSELGAAEQRERMLHDLQRIVAAVESRLPADGFSMQSLKSTTTEAIRELELERAIESRGLRKLAGSGIAQGLMTSAIFEVIKLVWHA